MKVLITGPRDFPSEILVEEVLDLVHAHTRITIMVHGGARGVDTFAANWAFRHGIEVRPYAPVEALDGKWPGAGPCRNGRMLAAERYELGMGIAFGGKLGGTADMMQKLIKARVEVLRVEGTGFPYLTELLVPGEVGDGLKEGVHL